MTFAQKMSNSIIKLLCCIMLIIAGNLTYASASNPIIKTKVSKITGGFISGKINNGLYEYLGIPYAAPPVGKLRWRPPQKIAPWQGVKAFTQFGPSCPQPPSEAENDVGPMNEDCLYLNVWTPSVRPNAKLPVMVWIYGGGFIKGSGSIKNYNGEKLAQMGVVVVTLNYRLGALGFLAHPLLSKESPHGVSGNYGILDQIAALKWVQKNITAFGGNPKNVTIFGESAGAMSTTLLTLTPLAKGLFHAVIAESGNPLVGVQYILPGATGSFSQALKNGKYFTGVVGCNSAKNKLACLRAKSPAALINATGTCMGTCPAEILFMPVFDGWIFPSDASTLYEKGKQADVPILIGTNTNEGGAFFGDITAAQYKAWLQDITKQYTSQILKMFPANNQGSAVKAVNSLFTVLSFTEPAQYVAKMMQRKNPNVYLYQFTRVPNTKAAKQQGAFHGIEIPYVFGHLTKAQGYNQVDFNLSQTIMHYWVNFAKKGNPNSPTLPKWPTYNKHTKKHLEFGDKIKAKDNLEQKASALCAKIRMENRKRLPRKP